MPLYREFSILKGKKWHLNLICQKRPIFKSLSESLQLSVIRETLEFSIKPLKAEKNVSVVSLTFFKTIRMIRSHWSRLLASHYFFLAQTILFNKFSRISWIKLISINYFVFPN